MQEKNLPERTAWVLQKYKNGGVNEGWRTAPPRSPRTVLVSSQSLSLLPSLLPSSPFPALPWQPSTSTRFRLGHRASLIIGRDWDLPIPLTWPSTGSAPSVESGINRTQSAFWEKKKHKKLSKALFFRREHVRLLRLSSCYCIQLLRRRDDVTQACALIILCARA